MKKPRVLIAAALLVHALAWFLPVVREGVTLPHGLPGWQAFRVAACAVWPYDGFKIDGWFGITLSTLSAATTVLFVLGAAWVITVRAAKLSRVYAWIAVGCFLVDAYWILTFGSDWLDLRVGYYLWWASFLLLAIALFRLSRALERAGSQNQTQH